MIKHSNKLCETQFTETNQIMAKLLALSSRDVQHKPLEGEVANRFIFIQRAVKKGFIKARES